MSESFRGEFNQKVDAKARVSVPASFRRVIEAGDPDWTPGKRPRFVLVYGDPSRQWAEGYTMVGIRKLERRILKMRLGDKARKALQFNMLTLSQELEIDEDGRIVVPPKVRAKIGATDLSGGVETVFAGSLDTFQLWHRDAYDAEFAELMAGADDLLEEGQDLLALLPDEDEEE